MGRKYICVYENYQSRGVSYKKPFNRPQRLGSQKIKGIVCCKTPLNPVMCVRRQNTEEPSCYKTLIKSRMCLGKRKPQTILFIWKEPQLGPQGPLGGPLGSLHSFSELSGDHRSPGPVPEGLQSVGLQQGPLAVSFFRETF